MIRRAAPLAAGLAVVLGVLAALSPPAARPADDAVRGVALGLFASDPDYDYGPMLAEIADRGATDVLLAVAWYQPALDATRMAPRPGYSPSDAAIARALAEARARGLRPALLPIVRLERRAPGHWRGVLRPADVDAWFSAYGAFVGRMADLAADGGAVRLYVGSELASLAVHGDRWRALIADVRLRFAGRLSYSANWDHFADIDFWDALDEIGVTGYFPLPAAREARADAWIEPRRRIAALAARHRRPVVLTEVGYPSRATAAARPWDDGGAAAPDLALQAQLFDDFCRAWATAGVARGFYAWNWFGVGGPRDAGFSLRGKPAAARLAACLRAWVAPDDTTPSAVDPSDTDR